MDLHDYADVALNYDFYLPEVVKNTYYILTTVRYAAASRNQLAKRVWISAMPLTASPNYLYK